MDIEAANYPDIYVAKDNLNPTILSPNAYYNIQFALTKEASYDLEEYKNFIDSSIREFRTSRTYKSYKHYIISLGLDCCQFHPYIRQRTDEKNNMATLEMHHCMLTIYDIAIMITEHYLNTIGQLTEFDLSDLLRLEHIENRVPITMLCKTCHQQYHHKFLYIPPNMIFGKWWELIDRYKRGLTRDIVYKVLMYLNKCINEDRLDRNIERDKKILQLREDIMNWSATGCSVR